MKQSYKKSILFNGLGRGNYRLIIFFIAGLFLFGKATNAQYNNVTGLPIAFWDFELNSNRTVAELTPELAINTGNTFDGKFGSTTTVSASAGHGTYYSASGTAGNAISAGFFQASGSADPGAAATTYFQFSLNTTGFAGISGFLDLYAGNTALNYPDAGMSYSINGGASYIALGPISTTNGAWLSGIKYTLPASADNNPNVKIRVYGYFSNNTVNNILRVDNFSVFATSTVVGAGTKTSVNEAAFYTGTTSGVTASQWIRYGTFTVSSGSTLVLGNSGIALGSTAVAGALTVASGGSLDCGGSTIQTVFAGQTGASSTFTLNSGGSIIIRDAAGITSSGATGNIRTTTRTFNAAANYTYANPQSAVQSTGTGLPAALTGNLAINNTGGVTLTQATSIGSPGILTLTNGTLATTTTNTISLTNTAAGAIVGGSNTSFIRGPLNRSLPSGLVSGGSVYNFPVGNGTAYLPYSITSVNTGASGPVLQISAFSSNAGGTPDNSTVSSVSTTEYWQTRVISGIYSGASLSLFRQTPVGPSFDVIAKGASISSAATVYSSLGGTAAGNGVINSGQTGAIPAGESQFNLFAHSSFNIVSSAGANGTISPTGTTNVPGGSNQIYTITPNACYSIANVVVDGISQGPVATYTFTNVTSTHTITATFSFNTYTITATSGANGSVTPAGESVVDCGGSLVYTITPAACYRIDDVLVDGGSVGAVSSYTFSNVEANHTISAIFSLNVYTITATGGANGSVTPAGPSQVNCGNNLVYTITPDACYSVSNVLVDGNSVGAVGTYTFSNVGADHTISATFIQNTYTITATSGANGSVTPAGASTVNCGDSAVFTITPAACYHVDNVLVDGSSAGAVTSYTFYNVQGNHTISATFAINLPLATPGPLNGPKNACPYVGTGEQVTYSVPAIQGAISYNWIVPSTVTIISGQGTNSIVVTFSAAFTSGANKQFKITALSSCGNSPQATFILLAQLPGTPQPIIASSNNICPVIGTSGTITYTIPKVTAATSYNWATQAGTTTVSHPNGTGVNDTTITVSFSNGFTTSAVTVQAVNGCGTTGARSLTITRNNPATPGPITGPTNACPYIAPNGIPATYSINAVANATSYTWTIPANSTGLTGQGTTSISFTYPSGFTSGTVSVTSTNGCGTSGARTLSITKLNPATPGVIDVMQNAACPERMFTYTISMMPANATSIQWTVPSGATLISGQGTNSITVSYPATAVNGAVTAQAVNNCGVSVIRSSSVKLPACAGGRPEATFSKGMVEPVIQATETIAVNVFPNPSVSDFKVQVLTQGKEKIMVRISDMQGRALKQLVVMPNQMISIGADLKAGSYIMEARQGNEVRTTKLLKF